jgi:hypothetical protein
MEFVVFDEDEDEVEVDSIDPYRSHREVPGGYMVRNHAGEYQVTIPEGGRYEIRPWRER